MDTPENKDLKPKSPHAEREERILSFWNEKDVFKKSLDKDAPKGDFTFYDGPPFATGSPHYGHILAGTIKDVIPRYKTMQGYRVRRRWGWDCHGLPVENIVEKELGLKARKDIVDYGIGKFNEIARETVMRYADEWRKIVPRMGRWVDMDDDYRTMDSSYTETVWWIFKNLFDKGLIYEGFKSMNLCPHCGTTLSNFEVAQGYKDITDISVFAKFELIGEQNTFIVAWTTTPWTLPGNVALAVNPAIEYVKVKTASVKGQMDSAEAILIIAESRLKSALGDQKYEIIGKIKGPDLIGKSYKPLFDYYSKDATLKNKENGWKIYGADFVTTEDGTGVVHIAPAFGADDYDLSLKYKLPFVQHVATDGKFKKEVTDFAGLSVKPKDSEQEKDAHQKTDIEIIKWLAHNNKLFAKEKLIHSYPHCWRCETPLLNYASSSWFVKVTDLKDKLVKENKKITWVPPEVGAARFGNWLEGARDWAISRTRFWGAPIPVWKEENKDGGAEKCHIIGSVDDLKRFSKAKNTYYVMRHGEAENNVKAILSSKFDNPHALTDKGKDQVSRALADFKNKKIDLVISSDFLRTKQTAEMAADALGLSKDAIVYDRRIREFDAGDFNLKDLAEYHAYIGSFIGGFTKTPPNGENYFDVKKRVGDFLYEAESTYQGKNILIISHETPIWAMYSVGSGLDVEKSAEAHGQRDDFIKNGEIRPLDFMPLPHNADYELDLHRPFIDDFELRTPEGNKLTRVQDVFDCWFESGSMPYAEAHYPFEQGKGVEEGQVFDPRSSLFKKSKGYPADFIAEGLDQTRGWFYSMLVLGVALFGHAPYKKVIVNGLILAEDGQKMSKSKQNFPDPMLLVDKYGADPMRYYMLSSPVVHGQDLRFTEKGVDEVTKKLVNRLLNVVSFYEMYADKGVGYRRSADRADGGLQGAGKSQNVLDLWIMSRLNQMTAEVTDGLEKGELDRATRPFMDFVDDLSTWYLRRSRDRFKDDDAADKQAALETTRTVLLGIVTVLAPFMPFLAEDIYRRVGGGKESVHLEGWPAILKTNIQLIVDMKIVREVASRALEARITKKINVRQPLSSLSSGTTIEASLIPILKDEINVKEFKFKAGLERDELDTALTPALKEEGMVRELVRNIQDLRKEKGLNVSDIVTLKVETSGEGRMLVEKNEKGISKTTSLKEVQFGSVQGKEIMVGGIAFKLDI